MSDRNLRRSSDRSESSAARPTESQTWPADADQPTAQARPPHSGRSENVVPPVAHVKPTRSHRSSSEGTPRASPRLDTGMMNPHEGWTDFTPTALSRLRQQLHRTLHAAILVTQAVDAGKDTPILSPVSEVQMIVLQARLSGFVFLLREFLNSRSSEAGHDDWEYVRPASTDNVPTPFVITADPSEPEEVDWVTLARADDRQEAAMSRSAKRRTRRLRRAKAKFAGAVSECTEAAQRES